MEKKMFLNASARIFGIAKQLRETQTEAEQVLWDYLRTRPLGFKFRRQHPLGIYIADFFCFKLKLIIEVDGNIHESEASKKHDSMRTNWFQEADIEVIRFKNEEVLVKRKSVIDQIETFIKSKLLTLPF